MTCPSLCDIHAKQKTDCPFIRSMIASSRSDAARHTSTSNEQENLTKRQTIETDLLQKMRRRSFSHWSQRTNPSADQMINAGFFSCNIDDRVICIYCNLICQQWTPHTDDPCEVHKTLSPDCAYAKTLSLHREPRYLINNDKNLMEATANNPPSISNKIDSLRFSQSVDPLVQNNTDSTTPDNLSSSFMSSNDQSQSIDDKIQGGYINTGTITADTCFYCNELLQNGEKNDDPMIEHARRFPDCPGVKQLATIERYRKAQDSTREKQEYIGDIGLKDKTGSDPNDTLNSNRENEINPFELVEIELNLSVSSPLRNEILQLFINRRRSEDQLCIKDGKDRLSNDDLYMDCLIFQKQLENINGKEENIVIPSEKMKQFKKDSQSEQIETPQSCAGKASTLVSDIQSKPTLISNDTDFERIALLPSSADLTLETITNKNHHETTTMKSTTTDTNIDNQSNDLTICNSCFVGISERRLACISCGRIKNDTPGGPLSLSCPICWQPVKEFFIISV